ncbi:MAG: hypothetical protein ACYSWU_09785 [Planctomycetota bacterium]
METVKCEHCKSVMGLVKKTPRWALYKCFSCRRVMGQINKDLNRCEFEDATEEMNTYALPLMDDELADIKKRFQSMSPEELGEFFFGRDDIPS